MNDAEMLANASPQELRRLFRNGLVRPTTGLAAGYAQANLVIMPSKYALDFAAFCQKNPKPCPLLEMGSPGDPKTRFVAKDADVRTDISAYFVYRDGVLVDKVTDISSLWNDDLVYFLLGCSFGFESALVSNGIPVRHMEKGVNVPMYITNIDCIPSGPFHGEMVVTLRGIPGHLVPKAVTLTARYPLSHEAPIYIGDPAGLGIKDLDNPDYDDKPIIEPGDVPVFWACGVTAQKIANDARLPLVIGHAPGHMFIIDLLNEDLRYEGV